MPPTTFRPPPLKLVKQCKSYEFIFSNLVYTIIYDCGDICGLHYFQQIYTVCIQLLLALRGLHEPCARSWASQRTTPRPLVGVKSWIGLGTGLHKSQGF